MELEKAIDELERGTRQNRSTNNQSLRQALKLGIEALKRVKAGRPAPPSLAFLPLPGETEK